LDRAEFWACVLSVPATLGSGTSGLDVMPAATVGLARSLVIWVPSGELGVGVEGVPEPVRVGAGLPLVSRSPVLVKPPSPVPGPLGPLPKISVTPPEGVKAVVL